jgi:hypothetical protein
MENVYILGYCANESARRSAPAPAVVCVSGTDNRSSFSPEILDVGGRGSVYND